MVDIIQNVLSHKMEERVFATRLPVFLPDLDRAVLKCSPSHFDTRIVFVHPFKCALISVHFLGPRSVNC